MICKLFALISRVQPMQSRCDLPGSDAIWATMMRYDAIWINNVFLRIVYEKDSFIPLGIKFCSPKRHPITHSN